jgi:hypothetical protein
MDAMLLQVDGAQKDILPLIRHRAKDVGLSNGGFGVSLRVHHQDLREKQVSFSPSSERPYHLRIHDLIKSFLTEQSRFLNMKVCS